jgi:hypothetical protein
MSSVGESAIEIGASGALRLPDVVFTETPYELTQRLIEVLNQIVRVFKTDGQSQQTFR